MRRTLAAGQVAAKEKAGPSFDGCTKSVLLDKPVLPAVRQPLILGAKAF